MDQQEAAEACAEVSRFTAEQWRPIIDEYWAAGFDLGDFVRWVETSGHPSPWYATAALPLVNTARVRAQDFEETLQRIGEVMTEDDCAHPDDEQTTLGAVEANEFGDGDPSEDVYVIQCRVCGDEWERPKQPQDVR